jgi:hypothetical protein
MKHNMRIGRVGGLALGFGIGAAVSAMPWVAFADPSVDPLSSIDLGALAVPDAASTPTLNLAISFDGMTLFQEGTASATSGAGDFAIADGDGSYADAEGGMANFAGADGDASYAQAIGGNFDYASATGANALALSGETTGNFDTAIADGTNSTALTGFGGDGDLASVVGDGGLVSAIEGNNDIATAIGSNANDFAGDGNYDLASIFGDNDLGYAAVGNNDIAAIFGADSVAQAGLLEDDGFLGSNDLTAAFGSELTANALGNAITTIEPSSLAALFGL